MIIFSKQFECYFYQNGFTQEICLKHAHETKYILIIYVNVQNLSKTRIFGMKIKMNY